MPSTSLAIAAMSRAADPSLSVMLGVAPHSLYDTKNNAPEFAETHA